MREWIVRGATAPDVHPVLLQEVELTLHPTSGESIDLRTRVLDVEPRPDGSSTMVVACPEGYDPLEHHFDATVGWTYPLGRMECAVATSPAHRAYGRVWLLNPTAPPTRLQQRAYFRARIAVPTVVEWTPEPETEPAVRLASEPAPDPEPESITGQVVDISEGGFLATSRVRPPAVGTRVEATVRVHGENLCQEARVVRHVAFANGTHGMGVAFADPAVHGDKLRRLVFETERRRLR